MQQFESKKSGDTRRCFETGKFVKICKRRINSIGGGREGRKKFFFRKSFWIQNEKKFLDLF